MTISKYICYVGKKRIYRFFTWLFSILAVLFASITVLLWVYKDDICGMAINEANKYLKAKVQVSDVDLEFWGTFPNLSIDFNNVYIPDSFSDSLQTDTLLFTERIRCRFNPLDLWNENYNIKTVEIAPGRLKLKFNDEGENNYDVFKKNESSEESDFKLKLEKVFIENLDLSYENTATRQFYSTRISQLAFAGNLDQRSFTASTVGRLDIAEAISGEVRLVKDQKAELNLRINVNLDSASFEIPSSTIYIADLPFNFSGKYHTLNYEFNVNGQNLLIDQVANKLAFKETEDVKRLSGHGSVKFDLNIKGNSDPQSTPNVDCNFGVNKGSLTDPSSGLRITAINLNGLYTNGTGSKKEELRLSNVGFKTKLGACSGELSITNFGSPDYKGKASGIVDLAALQAMLKLGQVEEIKGSLDVKTNFHVAQRQDKNGRDQINFRRLNGSLSLGNVSLRLTDDQRLFSSINGDAFFKGDAVGVQNIRMRLAETDLEISGLFDGLSDYINDIKPLAIKADVHSNKVRLADLTQSSKSQKISGDRRYILPDNIEGDVSVSIGKLSYEGHTFESCSGNLSFKDRKMDLNHFHFMNAGANASGFISVHETRPEILTLSGKIVSNNIEFNKVFKEWNSFGQDVITDKNISGVAKVNIDLTVPFDYRNGVISNGIKAEIGLAVDNGRLRNVESFDHIITSLNETTSAKLLIGKNNIRSFGQKLKDLRFDHLENTIVIRNSVLSIPQMSIHSSALDVELSGKHTFDNNIDYRIGFRFRDLKEKKGSEFGEVVDDGTGVMIFLRMYGNLDDPTIEWDKQSNQEKRKQEKEEAVRDAKSILKSEFGLFKNDTTVKTYVQEKFQHEEIEFDFNPVEENDTIIEKKVKKDTRLNRWLKKMKEESNDQKDEEFVIDG